MTSGCEDRRHENTDDEAGEDDDDLSVVSVTTQSSCATSSTQNLQNVYADGFLLPLDLKETCADLVSKKAMVEEIYADMMNMKLEIEEKMIEISQSFSGSMEEFFLHFSMLVFMIINGLLHLVGNLVIALVTILFVFQSLSLKKKFNISKDVQEFKLKKQQDDLGVVSMRTLSSCVTSAQNSENASADGLLLELNLIQEIW